MIDVMKNTNNEKLYIRLVEQANANFRSILLANLLNSIIVIFILRNLVSSTKLSIWFVSLVVITTARSIYAHFASTASYSQAIRNGRIYLFGLALTGIVWGMLPIFLFPKSSLAHQIFIAFVVGGMVVGASVTSAVLQKAFLAFSIPALAPLTSRLFFIGTDITNAMGFMLLIFFFCTLLISKQIQTAFIQTIVANLEKEKEIEIREKAENELRKHQENLENTVINRTKELHETNTNLARQIQERKLTERKYQEIFNSTTDAMLILEATTGKILEVNQTMLEMYEYSLEETTNLNIGDLIEGTSPYSQEDLDEKLQAATMHGPQIFEWRAKRKNQKLFWVEIVLKYAEIEGGHYIIAVVRDIEARKIDAENRLKVKKLESIGVLAGGIAHDFNNILTGILGNISLALFDKSIKSETKDILNEANKACVRAKDLTNQLLTFSKGGEPIKKTSSLQEIIRDSASFVLHGGKTFCEFHIPEDLFLVSIDKGQISQVIQNIVLNANHAMPNGGTIRIICENIFSTENVPEPLSPHGKHVKIQIIDTGCGISATHIDQIFDPYFSTKSAGSGLGLAICQSIISKHHGSITASSIQGEGSAFTILLPASSCQQPQKEGITETETTLSVEHQKILVMDDEEIVRNIIKAMLIKMGFDVILAKDGAEAVKVYADSYHSQAPVDLIILDLTIPGGMGGKDAVKKILEINPDAKVVVSSGYSNDPIMARYKEFGFCSAIEKPFMFQYVKKTIIPLLM